MLDSLEHLNRLQVQPSSSPRLAGHSIGGKKMFNLVVQLIIAITTWVLGGLAVALIGVNFDVVHESGPAQWAAFFLLLSSLGAAGMAACSHEIRERIKG